MSDASSDPAPERVAAGEQTPSKGSSAAPFRAIAASSAGFRLPFEALGMLGRERGLWALASVPFLFSLLAAAGAVALIVSQAGALQTLISGLLPVFDVEAWYQWIWLGPLRFVIWLVGHLLFAMAAALSLVVAVLLASVAAAPFLDALSYRVEQIVAGEVRDASGEGFAALLRDAARSLGNEARRVAFFLGIWSLLFAVGLIVPGAQLVTGPLMLGVTILFLPIDYAGYSLDRRQIPFALRRRWIRSHWPRMAGFGVAAFLACFVPILNLAMIPVLVVAGTLLVVRHPPDGLVGAD